MDKDDSRLVELTLKGETGAFEALVRKYQSAVCGLAFQRAGTLSAAEEIAQEAFTLAYRKLHTLKDSNRFPEWLRSIALRSSAMWLRSQRKHKKEKSLPEEDLVALADRVDEPAGLAESSFDIEGIILTLPRGMRAAAVLCLLKDLSPSDAARVLKINPVTLRKRLHDARARLQRHIVQKAERELRLHLLPKDFAKRCVCRCQRAKYARGERR